MEHRPFFAVALVIFAMALIAGCTANMTVEEHYPVYQEPQPQPPQPQPVIVDEPDAQTVPYSPYVPSTDSTQSVDISPLEPADNLTMKQYTLYFAYFNNQSRLNSAYQAIKAMESEGIIQIVAVSHPDDRNMKINVNYQRQIFRLEQELRTVFRRYGLPLSLQTQTVQIVITE